MSIDWEAINQWDLPEAILGSEDITLDLLSKFSNNDSREVRSAVALHPKTSPEIVRELESDESQHVRASTVYRDLPNEWITTDEHKIYRKVQREESLSEKIQEILVRSEDALLKTYLAQRLDLTPRVVDKLSKESDPYILEALRERNLPEEWKTDSKDQKLISRDASGERIEEIVLEILSDSTDSNIRRCVAINQFTPTHVVEKLKHDPDPQVSSTIKLRNLPARLRCVSPYELAATVLDDDDLSPDQLDSLSYCWIDEVRAAVAAKDLTSSATLQRLSEDNSKSVQNAIKLKAYPNRYRALSTRGLKSLLLSNEEIPEGLVQTYAEKDYDYSEIIKNFGSIKNVAEMDGFELTIKKKYFSIHGPGIESLRTQIEAMTPKTNEEAVCDYLDRDLGDEYFSHTLEDKLVASEIRVSDLELKDENDCICFTCEFIFDQIHPVDPVEFLNMLRDNSDDIGSYSLQVKHEILKKYGLRNLRYYDPEVSISLEKSLNKPSELDVAAVKLQLKALYPWVVSRGGMDDDVCTSIKVYGLIAESSRFNSFWLFSSESDEFIYMRKESDATKHLRDGKTSEVLAELLEQPLLKWAVLLGSDTKKTSRLIAHNLKFEDHSQEFTSSKESDSAIFEEVVRASNFDGEIGEATACYSWKYSFEHSDQECLSKLNLEKDSDLLSHFRKNLNLSLLEPLGIKPSIDFNRISFHDALE